MKPRERARSVINAFCSIPDYRMIDPKALDLHMGRLITDAIIAAEEAKAKEVREACVKLSDLIATRIWGYCQSVDWGTGKAMMEQREIERIIIDTIGARSEG